MERVVNIARSHKEADDWDVRQQVAMTPQERIRASRELRRRAYPPPNRDVRECHDKPQKPIRSPRMFLSFSNSWSTTGCDP